MWQGSTILAGDSMLVSVSPFVQVNGDKREIAAVGRTIDQLFQALQTSTLAGAKTMLVLVGANDISGGQTADRLFQSLQAIWSFAKKQGIRVVAMTVPPDKGWAGFATNFPAVNAKRKALNAQIRASNIPDQVIDLESLMADPKDADALSPAFDSGDHLHPKKDAFGALLTKASDPSAISPSAGGPVVALPGLQVSFTNAALTAGTIIGLVFGFRALSRTRFYKRTLA